MLSQVNKRVLGRTSNALLKVERKAVTTNFARAYTTNKEKADLLVKHYKAINEAIAKGTADEPAQLFNQLYGNEGKSAEEVATLKEMFVAISNVVSDPKFAKVSQKGLKKFDELSRVALAHANESAQPVKVAITGASGQIGYALLFRIASGQMFGPTTPVEFQLLELPGAMNALQGVIMELQDCAFPLVRSIKAFDNPEKAFEDIDYALLVGAKPRAKGMERGDLLTANAEIFSAQGKALNKFAKKTVKVAVVGNPANTNAMIAQRNAPSIPAQNFTAMTRLDHNRALAQLSLKTGARVTDIENLAIWGNHSATQYPSIAHALINNKPAAEVINDNQWVVNKFIPDVQQRGAAIIAARGSSSAASAASSLIDHMHDWIHSTGGAWTSMAVISNGQYGVDEGLCYSYPVVTESGNYVVVEDLEIDPFSAERMEKSHQELKAERDAIAHLLPK